MQHKIPLILIGKWYFKLEQYKNILSSKRDITINGIPLFILYAPVVKLVKASDLGSEEFKGSIPFRGTYISRIDGIGRHNGLKLHEHKL